MWKLKVGEVRGSRATLDGADGRAWRDRVVLVCMCTRDERDNDIVPELSRRSQLERRESTRAALLDAAIDVLIKHGRVNLTTDAVVRRAGVTRGAHAHYFDSKADLLVQALDRLLDKIADDATRTLSSLPDGAMESYEILLDHLWAIHRGPLFTAAIELHVAARTDSDLRGHVQRFDRELTMRLLVEGAKIVPALIALPNFESVFATAMAAIRGVALLGFTASPATVDRTWAGVRSELIRAAQITSDGTASSIGRTARIAISDKTGIHRA